MYFNDLDNAYYIGCSSRLNARKKEHLNDLKANKHSNYKLQDAYNIYGSIEFDILEFCSVEELYFREEYWVKEFDSYNNGFNLTNGGIGIGYGIGNPNTKYSEDIYINIIKEIAYTNKTAKQIANKFGVTVGIVKPIICQSNHSWLKYICPIEYEIVSNKQKLLKLNNKKLLPKLKSPNGTIIEINTSARQFALFNSLDPSRLSKLLGGKIGTYKGYSIYNESNN